MLRSYDYSVVVMVSPLALCCLISGLAIGQAWGNPMPVQPVRSDFNPLVLVSDLASRLHSGPSRLQDSYLQDVRLPLPTSQDIDTIKKVAQILVMLGQQVIPATIGEPAPIPGICDPASKSDDVPNDPVNIDKQAY